MQALAGKLAGAFALIGWGGFCSDARRRPAMTPNDHHGQEGKAIGILYMRSGGVLLFRSLPGSGSALRGGQYRIDAEPDGSARFERLREWIDTETAMGLLGVKRERLRWLWETGRVMARRQTPSRIILAQDTVMSALWCMQDNGHWGEPGCRDHAYQKPENEGIAA